MRNCWKSYQEKSWRLKRKIKKLGGINIIRIRIYPLTRIKSENPINYVSSLSETTRIAEKETRNIVLSIQKYLKAAKEVHKKNEKYRDEQYNATLRKMMELNTEIWLPSK